MSNHLTNNVVWCCDVTGHGNYFIIKTANQKFVNDLSSR
jgi:hypothetical protein